MNELYKSMVGKKVKIVEVRSIPSHSGEDKYRNILNSIIDFNMMPYHNNFWGQPCLTTRKYGGHCGARYEIYRKQTVIIVE